MRRALGGLWLAAALVAAPGDYCKIRIVDQSTGRGIPLVELRTMNEISAWTDSNGIVAWSEPGLTDRDVYFHIESPGYKIAGDAKIVRATRGATVELKMERLNIAERLYRVTGQGIYADSVLTGHPGIPIREPLLNSEVLGQDTVMVAPYRGKLFWIWGDTNRASRRLGNFAATGATSDPRDDPARGIDFTYFVGPDGFAKAMCPLPVKGMKWLSGLMNVRDPQGRERLVAHYGSYQDLETTNEEGVVVFNDEKQVFQPLAKFPLRKKSQLLGRPFRHGEYFYFCSLFAIPSVRVRANWSDVQDEARYESLTPEGWKPGIMQAPLGDDAERFTDVETGTRIAAHAGVNWNAYRQRWIGILQKHVGEVWYAEADSPAGPWVYARRIATHGKYTYYWPIHHPWFDQDGGRVIYFEGTYTAAFSGNPKLTPRYDYNQLMYRIALDDARLMLPAPVYRMKDGSYRMGARQLSGAAEVAFFALEPARGSAGTVLVDNLFRGDRAASGPHRVALYRTPRGYSITPPEADATPLCWVWRNPLRRLP